MHRRSDPMTISRYWRHFGVAALLVASTILSACANSGRNPESTREYLDPLSGVTINALTQPLILAHAEPRLSNSLRDYLYVGPVEVNRMGKRSYYLWIGPFSTLDRPPVTFSHITLKAGDTTTKLDLPAEGGNAAEIRTPPYSRPLEQTPGYYIPVPAELLADLAGAKSISIETHTDTLTNYYSLWRGEPTALRQFANHIGITPATN